VAFTLGHEKGLNWPSLGGSQVSNTRPGAPFRLFPWNGFGGCVLVSISDHPLGATFSIRVQPKAARTAITGTVGEALKVSLSAPPLEGRANVAVVEFFSEILADPRSSVQIVTGERSRNKIVRIAGCSSAHVLRRLREHFTV
jgi:uncharacterized protein (TIGR00251 family)